MPTVIVTGGTVGIGYGISLHLARRAYHVVAFGLDAAGPSHPTQSAATLLEEAARDGLALDVLQADVSCAGEVETIVERALRVDGRIEALVNNAAIGPLGTILDTTEDAWDRIIDVNLKGMFLMCKAVIPHMQRQGGGAIVNIGSGAGWGKPNMFAYAASKGGVFALSTALAYDHFHDHIRVNVVVPGGGGIPTGMSLQRVGNDPVRLRDAVGSVAGRHVTTDDVAAAVGFLLSAEAETITGSVIDVGCFARQGGPIPPPPVPVGWGAA